MKENILRLLELAKGWNSDMPYEKEQSFSIIPRMYERISSKELLHSEIIAELLRPDGTHNCGDLFLQEFMRSIEIDDPQAQDFSSVEVKREESTNENRRIDILIVWGNNAVIIENKLNNAVDQPDQLKDYLKDTENKGKKVLKVVYIPLFAWKRVQEHIPADVKYLCPYDLSKWLEACAEENPDAREAVSPYIQLLNYMNQSNRNYMKTQELYEILKDQPELLQSAIQIATLINSPEWKQFLLNQLRESIENKIGNTNKTQFKTDTKGNPNGGKELWLWCEPCKYKVSVDIAADYFTIFLYTDKDSPQPEIDGIKSDKLYKQWHYYELQEKYRIGEHEDYDKMVVRIVELLEKSRK